MEKAIKEQALKIRHKNACTTVLRGLRYIMGSLPDYGFEFKPNFSDNPLEVNIRIFWTDDMDSWKPTYAILKDKIKKLEDELSSIKQGIPNA